MGWDDIDDPPRVCPDCGVLLRPTSAGDRCPACGHLEPYDVVEWPGDPLLPGIHGG